MGRDFREVRRSSPATFNAPLRWKEGRRIFTCSISDFFIEEADAWRDEAWEIIRQTPQHTYQILTKRPERIAEHLAWYPLPNVWLGTSVENQKYAEERIPILTSISAKVHFLSVEPMLGPVSLEGFRKVEWVICGGESGPNFRPMDLDWARRIRDQCIASGVPFFFKQRSGPRSEMNPILDGREWREMPD